MKLTITIDLDNAAFEECQGDEAARILLKLASTLEGNINLGNARVPLLDLNGNNVGQAVVTPA